MQHAENRRLIERNELAEAELRDLKMGNEAAEERAREQLDMIKRGEKYYFVSSE